MAPVENGPTIRRSRRAASILFVDSFTTEAPRAPCSSDAIGWGSTAADVIAIGLEDRGLLVTRCPVEVPTRHDRSSSMKFVLDAYQQALCELLTSPPDLIFVFHAFSAFPVELRRMALTLGLSIPMVGYSHGSHWDPSDSVRHEEFPGLQYLDLANLACLDALLLVSNHMRKTLSTSISGFNAELGRLISSRSRVVGLPLNIELIERHRVSRHIDMVSIIYNHSPASSKNGDVFGRVMYRILKRHRTVRLTITRLFSPEDRGYSEIQRLKRAFPDRVRLGGDLTKREYYRALWEADVQVSTATHESLGISTLEAMLTSTCCVVPRAGAYPEVCGKNSSALYDPGEYQLEHKLNALLESPDQRRRIAASLERRALLHSPDIVIGKIVTVIEDILARQRASG